MSTKQKTFKLSNGGTIRVTLWDNVEQVEFHTEIPSRSGRIMNSWFTLSGNDLSDFLEFLVRA